jgi:DNA gyrase subunit A
VANTHTQLLFFTTDGMVLKLKTWRLPQGSRTSKARRHQHPADPTGVQLPRSCRWIAMKKTGTMGVFTVSLRYRVRRSKLSDFTKVMRNGKIAVKFEARMRAYIINARICSDDDDVMLVTNSGRAIRCLHGCADMLFNSRASHRCAWHPPQRAESTKQCQCR